MAAAGGGVGGAAPSGLATLAAEMGATRGSVGGDGRLEALHEQLLGLLARQREMAAEFNRLLTEGDESLIEQTRLTMKNLDAAIATAKRPGYFKYHVVSDRVKTVERTGVLSAKARDIREIQVQIDRVREEIARIRRAAAEAAAPVPEVRSLAEWFARYKRPDPTLGGDGFRTSFVPSSRVYGGTSHYGAFRSVARTMKAGRMTR